MLALDRFSRAAQAEMRIRRRPLWRRLGSGERMYLAGLVVVVAYYFCLHPAAMRFLKPERAAAAAAAGSVPYPFLPLMLVSVYCALGGLRLRSWFIERFVLISYHLISSHLI